MYSTLLGMIGDGGKVIDMVSLTMAPVMDDVHLRGTVSGAAA